jgi:hypothetical protein
MTMVSTTTRLQNYESPKAELNIFRTMGNNKSICFEILVFEDDYYSAIDNQKYSWMCIYTTV